jgi:release factor glutamine methyltransferase
MTWREIVVKTSAYLASKSVPDPQTAAELLVARLLGCGRGTLGGALAQEAPERCVEAMRRGMARLVKGEPLQYVLCEWDFRTLTLKCDRRALIPRPETEELVTRVLKWLSRTRTGDPRLVLDVGTGTGAIALSIASETGPDVSVLATDVSEDALALARENARLCALEGRVRFVAMDGLDDFDEPGVVDALVSNPPYIESAVCDTLDPRVKDFEPRLALDGGPDGLAFYDRYLADALNVLRPGGAVFFEIGEGQGESLRRMMSDYGFTDISVEKDYAGHDRYASATLP